MWSQEKNLKGQIIADSIAFREVNVVNLNSKRGTVNQKDGYFEISAKAGDTIFFSSLQYEPYPIFNSKFYTDELGISENLIEDFLYFCVTFKSFSRLIEEEKKTLDLIEFLIEKSTAYKVFKELDNEQN